MNKDEFTWVIENQLKKVQSVLLEKSAEYSVEEDKLHNFRQASQLSGENLRRSLGGMMLKHTISVYDMIYSENGFDLEVWDEKITDHINYLLLLKAIVEDESMLTRLDDQTLPFESPNKSVPTAKDLAL